MKNTFKLFLSFLFFFMLLTMYTNIILCDTQIPFKSKQIKCRNQLPKMMSYVVIVGLHVCNIYLVYEARTPKTYISRTYYLYSNLP